MISLPTVGNVESFFGESGWHIMGLQQKVVMIYADCVLGWAGSWLGARVAIAELRSMAQRGVRLTVKSINACLDSIPDLKRFEAEFVGWVREGDRFERFTYGAATEVLPGLGEVALGGSGAGAIREFASLRLRMGQRMAGGVNPVAVAMSTAITLAGLLIRSEFAGGDSAPTLSSMFGGGYEVATFFGGQFRKIDDFTLVVWRAQISAGNVRIELPSLVLKHKYQDDVLILRGVRMGFGDGSWKMLEQQALLIRPMYELPKLISTAGYSVPQLESQLHLHIVEVERDGERGLFTQFKFEDGVPSLRFVDDERGFEFWVEPELYAGLEAGIREMWASDPPGHRE